MHRPAWLFVPLLAWALVGCEGNASTGPPSDVPGALGMDSGSDELSPDSDIDRRLDRWVYWHDYTEEAGWPEVLADVVLDLVFMDSVESDCVGCGAQPGPFYRLSEIICRVGTAERFRCLLEDDLVVVRVMAMVCLARTDPEGAIPLIRSRLGSRAEFVCYPGGCCGHWVTEGEFAWRLLRDRYYLETGRDEPLLEERQLMHLSRHILARRDLKHLHKDVSGYLRHVGR